ncbi:TonB-dependent receptor, partial [bacterium]|nr:TonB-dependent receptor [bacterium]
SAVTVITYREIQESGARSLPDLLSLVPGVNVRWNPMMQTIDIRGFGQSPFTSRVLLLIDGVPYNSWNKGGFPQQPGLDFFILQNIKQVEVIRGPSSALYGENAYWGVINIVTLSGDDVNGATIEAYGGERETRAAGAIYGRGIKNGSILVSAKFLQSQLPTEFWFQDNDSKIRGTDIFLKARYKDLTLSYYRHDDNVDGFELPIAGGVFRSAEEVKQSIDIVALQGEHTTKDQDVRFAGGISFARRNGMHCGSCHALPQNENFSRKEDHGFQLIGDFLMEISSLPLQSILVGVEGRKVDSKKHGERGLLQTDPTTGQPTVKDYSKLAVYVQDELSLAQDKFRLTAGFRYDGATNPDLFGDRVSPRVAGVYNPTERLILRAGWNRAFHFPDFSTLYQNTWFLNVDRGTMAIPFSTFNPNPGLKPEEIQNFDLGLEYRLSSNVLAKVNFFRSRVRNFIVIAIASDPGRIGFENHPDEANIWGSEFALRWNLKPRIRGFFNWAYQDQDQDGNLVDSTNKPFEFVYAPKHKINVGAYLGPFSGLRSSVELTWRDNYQGPSFWNSFVSGSEVVANIDGYAYLNLRLSYELPFDTGNVKRPLRLKFFGRNLLDEKPTETLLPISSRTAGREFFAGVEYRLPVK